MKRFVFIIGGCLLVLSGCVKDFDAETYNNQKNEAKIVANANRIPLPQEPFLLQLMLLSMILSRFRF